MKTWIKRATRIGCAAGLLLGCQAPVEAPLAAAPPALHLLTVKAEARPMPDALAVTGSLVPNRQADVAANATGVVLKTSVERGSPVAQGASLVQLDRRTVAFSEQEARANLHSAEAQQALAAAQGARNEALAKKGAISKDEWERVSSQCRVTHAAATAAQARAQMALKNINDSDVRAPFAGVVDERYVNLGEYVQPASRVVTLVELDPLRLQFSVGEREVSLVKVGQSVDFKVQAYGDEKFSGEVRYISAKLRSASRDVVVEAVVKNLDGRLHPGTFVSAQLHLGDRPQVAVPSTAVIKDGELSHVFAAAQGHVEMRLVQPGMSKADWVVIADGLQAGDQVVAVPDPSVRDGASID